MDFGFYAAQQNLERHASKYPQLTIRVGSVKRNFKTFYFAIAS